MSPGFTGDSLPVRVGSLGGTGWDRGRDPSTGSSCLHPPPSWPPFSPPYLFIYLLLSSLPIPIDIILMWFWKQFYYERLQIDTKPDRTVCHLCAHAVPRRCHCLLAAPWFHRPTPTPEGSPHVILTLIPDILRTCLFNSCVFIKFASLLCAYVALTRT